PGVSGGVYQGQMFLQMTRSVPADSPALQAGGRRFDPGWLHSRKAWKMAAIEAVGGENGGAFRPRWKRYGSLWNADVVRPVVLLADGWCCWHAVASELVPTRI